MSRRPVVLFRDEANGDYLIARQSPRAGVQYEELHEGDSVDLVDGRTARVTKVVQKGRAEMQVFCECPAPQKQGWRGTST